MSDAVQTRRVERRTDGKFESIDDRVVVEEPLEIRVAGETLAITMRTPGEDRELTVGYLFAEGIVRTREDLGRVHHCGRPDDEGYENVIDVLPGPGVSFDLGAFAGARRGTLTTSACGICGRRSIDDLLARIERVKEIGPIDPSRIEHATRVLRAHQPVFDATGGLHAAAILDAEDRVRASAEDVGRHNAVDKAVGRLVLDDTLAGVEILSVSGRASFEIIQKAASARIAVVVAVGAPSTLAIDLATRAGITLIGFSRDRGFTAYSHEARLAVPTSG